MGGVRGPDIVVVLSINTDLEVPVAAVAAAARAAGGLVVLNPAPARPLPAVQVAAAVVERPGAMDSLPSREQVLAQARRILRTIGAFLSRSVRLESIRPMRTVHSGATRLERTQLEGALEESCPRREPPSLSNP